MHKRSDLHPYQAEAVDHLLCADGRQEVAIMGAGKTVVALTAITELAPLDGIVLVVGPLAVVQSVWAREAAEWEHTAHLRISRVLGTEAQRKKALRAVADIYVVNYDNVHWFEKQIAQTSVKIAVLVADEASCLKTPTALRTQAMLRLADQAGRRWALTGTPRNHMLLDVWGPGQFVTQGRAFPPFMPWLESNFYPTDIYRRKWLPLDQGVEDAVVDAVRGYTHVVDAAALATRPPLVTVRHDILLPAAAEGLYEAIDQGTTAELAAAMAAGVTRPHVMTIVGKLMQVCSGAIYHESGDGSWTELHAERLDRLAEIHDGHARPTLVFVQYRHEQARVLARFPEAEAFDVKRIDAWNAGTIPMLVAHPASAGHGVNLQGGSDVVVWFGGTGWSAELWQQANARLARQGQASRTVTAHVLVCPGLVDDIAWRTVGQRVAAQDQLVEALRP
jgi:hypothetical protein